MNGKQLAMDTRRLAVKVLPTPVKQSFIHHRRDFLDAVIKYREVTGQLGPLPDFLIIGGQRCGSTYLYDRVREHPGIRSALIKEIHFFNTNKRYEKGADWYRGHFSAALLKPSHSANGSAQITGEASGYLYNPRTPERIAAMMPDVKIIALLRNPVDRAYSHYHHMRRLGFEHIESFEEAIDAEGDRLGAEDEQGIFGRHHSHHSYLSRGEYVDQLQLWFDRFPRENLRIIQSEEFYRSPSQVLRSTTAFLGLPDWKPKEYSGHKQFPYSNIHPETRARLEAHFRPHNERLSDLLGVDYGWNT